MWLCPRLYYYRSPRSSCTDFSPGGPPSPSPSSILTPPLVLGVYKQSRRNYTVCINKYFTLPRTNELRTITTIPPPVILMGPTDLGRVPFGVVPRWHSSSLSSSSYSRSLSSVGLGRLALAQPRPYRHSNHGYLHDCAVGSKPLGLAGLRDRGMTEEISEEGALDDDTLGRRSRRRSGRRFGEKSRLLHRSFDWTSE